jgi:hypothetical protein
MPSVSADAGHPFRSEAVTLRTVARSFERGARQVLVPAGMSPRHPVR